MCKVLAVSRNAYYYWRSKQGCAPPESRKQILKKQIKQVFTDSRQIYGSQKITIELHKMGITLSRSYVARLMQHMGMACRTLNDIVATTDNKQEYSLSEP